MPQRSRPSRALTLLCVTAGALCPATAAALDRATAGRAPVAKGDRQDPKAGDERKGPRTGAPGQSLQDLVAAQDPDLLPYPSEGDAPRIASIRRALAWLASRQRSDDGSVEVGDAVQSGQKAPLAVTSLTALAWMSGGSTLTRGEYQDNVRRAIEYLLANTHRAADDFPGYINDRSDSISRTHGHGLATLALAEAYTVSPNTPLGKRIGETLVLAVERIAVSQGAEGGWYYSASRSIQHEGSVTVSLVQALRAANDVGVRVDPEVIAEAVEYVRRLQVMEIAEDDPANDSADDPGDEGDGDSQKGARRGARRALGGFQYGLDDPETSIALTAAGLTTLQAAGVYTGSRIDEGYDYIWRRLAIRSEDGPRGADPFPYYERFYLSQALWHHRDQTHYRRWAEPIMRELVSSQSENGSWTDTRTGPKGQKYINRFGAAYATSCNVLFLALPDDTLPLFHR